MFWEILMASVYALGFFATIGSLLAATVETGNRVTVVDCVGFFIGSLIWPILWSFVVGYVATKFMADIAKPGLANTKSGSNQEK